MSWQNSAKRFSRAICLPLLCGSLLIFSVSGCTSALKKAEELFVAGQFEQSASAYESLVKREPGNPEALAGLQKSRQKLIEKKLIDARMIRLSGNSQRHLDALLEVMALEKQWQIFPSGQAMATREEEWELGFQAFSTQADLALQADLPVKAAWWRFQYGPLFSEKYVPALQSLGERTQKSGAIFCKSLRQGGLAGKPNYTLFVKKICEYFGAANVGSWPADFEKERQQSIGSLTISGQIVGLDSSESAFFAEALRARLKESPWYSPEGAAVLPIDLVGTYRLKQQRDPVRLTQGYEVDESYTVMEEVRRTRQVTGPGNVARMEEYTTREPVTHSRRVPRTHYYTAWKHDQELSLQMQASFSLDGKGVSLSLSESSKSEGFEHYEDRPQMGLKPQRPELQDPSPWLKERVNQWGVLFSEKLKEAWIDTRCRSTEGEGVIRCFKQPGTEDIGEVRSWFEQKLGITPQQTRDLLGGFR